MPPWISGGALAGLLLAVWGVAALMRDGPPPDPTPAVQAAEVTNGLSTGDGGARADASGAETATAATAIDATELIEAGASLGGVIENLIGLWQADVRVRSGENVCTVLREHMLECHRASSSWNEIERFDRPVVLTLQSAMGDTGHALVRNLADDEATVLVDGRPRRIDREALDALWTGEYLLLWRREADSDLIRPRDRGPAVSWLRTALARAAGEPVIGDASPVFDDALQTRVERFQRRHGLTADGYVGAKTQIMLTLLTGSDADPRLSAPVEVSTLSNSVRNGDR